MDDKKRNGLSADRFFGPNEKQKEIALDLYQQVRNLPLVCLHSHVDPKIFSKPDFNYSSPSELIIIPDHYIFRMLYSQGIPLERIGIPRRDGGQVEMDNRKIWQIFAENLFLFQGTPTGIWLAHELGDVFGVQETLKPENAQEIYDQVCEKLNSDEFKPRNLCDKFNIEVLCTTDSATDTLDHHRAIRNSGWSGRILPTFRPDGVINLDAERWLSNINALSEASGITVKNFRTLIQALEERRGYFKKMGAVATDHAVLTPYTEELKQHEAEAILQRALQGSISPDDVKRFTGHMLMEMARMSIDDGLVMQLHVGSYRNYNHSIFHRFGPDMGADIPIHTEFTCNLHPLLNQYGNHSRFNLILFTLDETSYARELAPLAGHYPSIKIGPPWWFHDSINGMKRFFEQVMETAGLYNTTGFNDDTRAFFSIPARHDTWRRVSCNWVAKLHLTGVVSRHDAEDMVQELAYGLAKRAYHL